MRRTGLRVTVSSAMVRRATNPSRRYHAITSTSSIGSEWSRMSQRSKRNVSENLSKNSRGVNTPVIEGPADRDEDSPLLDAHDKPEYQSAVGALQYLCQLSRPDLAFAVRCAAQRVAAPRTSHRDSLKRIFRYIAKTLDIGRRRRSVLGVFG